MTAVGDELPVLAIEMTATRIVAGAIATRDFMPVHHDRDYANSQGAPDIFMNIISTNAYCTRYLTDWAGPDAMLEAPRDPPRRPRLPGLDAHLHRHGHRRAARRRREEVDVEFRASNDLGDHATGTATLVAPAGAA